MTKPTKPTVPPAPSRSNPGATFSQTADTFAAFQSVFADYLDATAEFVDDRADAALAAALGGSLPPLTGQTGRFLRVASPTSVTFSPDLIQDASGNLGLGVVPSAWLSTVRAIQLGTGGSISNWTGSSGSLGLGANFYNDGSGAARYINTAAAAQFIVNTGSFSWFTAPSGTAGQPITFTQAMTLDASGNLAVIGRINGAIIANDAGQIGWFAMSTPPTGWLKANGAAVSRTTYAALFGAIGTTYGAGDGSTTFNLPDLRGEFLRAWDDGRGVDAGRVFGSAQSQDIQSHSHSIQIRQFNTNVGNGATSTILSGASFNTDAFGGTETRPRNIALLACIKF